MGYVPHAETGARLDLRTSWPYKNKYYGLMPFLGAVAGRGRGMKKFAGARVRQSLLAIAVATPLTDRAQGSVAYSGTMTNRADGQVLSGTATFDVLPGNELQITLSSLGSPVINPSDVLAAVFFDLKGVGTLTPLSAALAPGGTLVNGPVPVGQTLGDQWQYREGLSRRAPNHASRGMSSVGLSIFSWGNFGSNGQNLGGFDYGLSNGSPADGNGRMPTMPLVNNSIVFTLGGLPASFSLGDISNVGLQYGTKLSEPFLITRIVPEPGALALLGFLALLLTRRIRR